MPKRKRLLLKGPMRAGRAVDASTSSFKFTPTSVPTWVPDAVRKQALDGHLFVIHEKDKEVAQRLLTDKRMIRVWRELTKHNRHNNKLFHQPDRPTDTFSIPFDKTLGAFFDWACTAASLRPVLTKDEAVKVSNEIRMFPNFSGGVLISHSYLEVERHTTLDHVRAYVFELDKVCKILFHSSLYSTIATTASVALNTRVDATFVRSVLRNPPREQEIETHPKWAEVQSREAAPPTKNGKINTAAELKKKRLLG